MEERQRDSEYTSHSLWCCYQRAKTEEENGRVENEEHRREQETGGECEGEGDEKCL